MHATRTARIATVCTLLDSDHMQGIDPLAYLTDIIVKLQGGWPMKDIDALLPDAWSKNLAPAATMLDTAPTAPPA